MRLAIIDLGTNSVRFDVHQLGPGEHYQALHREKLMVRLGQGVFLNGKLNRSAVHRTLQALESFKRVSDSLRVGKIIAFGTSALREAADSDRFLNLVRRETGIDVRIIPGIEEARLIALGILSNERIGSRKFALIDIGGGSTEISVCSGNEVLNSRSFSLGSARLQQLFLKESPPEPKAVKQLRRYIRTILEKRIVAEEWPRVDLVVGSSGTIKALARILKKNGDWRRGLTREALRKLVKQMSKMTLKELLRLPGIESKRVDMFLAGAVLFEECLDALGAKKFEFTEYSLRDGVLQREIRHHAKYGASYSEIRIEDLFQRAREFSSVEARLKRGDVIISRLFDLLKPIHGLSNDWKIYLRAAMMFRDSGKTISLVHYAAHSYYIVKNADIPAAEPWELELIAQLCLYHQSDETSGEILSQIEQKKARQALPKLLAILRVADALDSGPDTTVRIRRCVIKKKSVSIFFTGTNLTGLEPIRVERQKGLFEDLFEKELKAVRGS